MNINSDEPYMPEAVAKNKSQTNDSEEDFRTETTNASNCSLISAQASVLVR